MSATEWWCLAAVIAAGLAAVLHLAGLPRVRHDGVEGVVTANLAAPALAQALTSAAVGLVAVALLVALP